MAQKRMFSKHITNDERFLEMPVSSQALYLHLNMNADDDGFIQPKRILRMVGAKEDDLRVLIAKGFILELPNTENVIVITHWKVNNTLRKDRYSVSHYNEHMKMLGISENMTYFPLWQPNGNQMAPQVSIGKDREGKEREERGAAEIRPPAAELWYTGSYFDITMDQYNSLKKTYPNIEFENEVNKMEIWLDSNPTRRKKNYARFISNWIARTAERLPKITKAATSADFQRYADEVKAKRAAAGKL